MIAYLVSMHKILLATVLACAALAGCAKSDKTAAEKAEADLVTMTVDEVDHAVTDKTAQAVDCNTDKTRKRAGVVPGAILISDHEGYAAGELPADKTMRLVFYCANPG